MSTSTIGTVWAETMRALTKSARAVGNAADLAERTTNVAVLRVTIYEQRETSRLKQELDDLLKE